MPQTERQRVPSAPGRMQQAPAAQQQSGAAVSKRERTTDTHAHATNTDTNDDTLMLDAGRQQQDAKERGSNAARDCTIPTRAMTIQPEPSTSLNTKPTEREEESLASMYAEKGTPMLNPAADRENEANDQHVENSDSQHTRATLPSSLPEQLIAALLPTGMPEHDMSLRRAILKHFEGRKKLLHEQTIAGQVCGLRKDGAHASGVPGQNAEQERGFDGGGSMGAEIDGAASRANCRDQSGIDARGRSKEMARERKDCERKKSLGTITEARRYAEKAAGIPLRDGHECCISAG